MAATPLIALALAACLMLAAHGASAQLGFSVEVDALIAFKNGLQDPQRALDSWDPNSVDPCTWFLLDCDANNKVQRLFLGRTGISGTISPRLADLSSLQSLALFGNNLRGSIPEELGQITTLTAIQLQDNALTGSIPPQLTLLSNLQILHLWNNDLSGPIPTGGSFSRFSSDSFAPGNPDLCGPVISKPC